MENDLLLGSIAWIVISLSLGYFAWMLFNIPTDRVFYVRDEL